MKEDIEWLRDYVKKDREVRGTTEFESDFDQFCERHCKAIENVLEENENLKQSLIINKNLYEEVCNKNKELEEENKELQKSVEQIYDDYQDAGRLMFEYSEKLEDSIPKSLIKEKIEELKAEGRIKNITFANCGDYIYQDKIEVLQELLGEEK